MAATKFDRQELVDRLGVLGPALGGALAALQHVWFDGKDATAYDSSLGIRVPLQIGSKCGVPGGTLLKLLNTSPLKDVSLSFDKNNLQVKLGSSTSKLSILVDGNAWPFPAGKGPACDLTEEFVAGLKKALIARSSTATRVEHLGVLVQSTKKRSDLYATDSYSLVRVGVPVIAGLPDRALLPWGFVEQLTKHCTEGGKIDIEDDYMVASGEGVTLYSQLLDITNAENLDGLITSNTKGMAEPTAIPPELDSALERATVLSGNEESLITLKVSGKTLTVLGDYNLNTLDEDLKLEKSLPDCELKLDAKLLKKGLAYSDQFALSNDVITLHGKDNFLYLCPGKG
jgi:hypothetical protein